MSLDKLLLKQIGPVGKSIMNKAGLSSPPQNINEMALFLEQVKTSIENEDFDGLMVGNILFSFVSSIEVRDRHTSSRIFEDIFCSLFGINATDTERRTNPTIPDEVKDLNKFNTPSDEWQISTDLSSNKREKSDVLLGNYSISLKTLKGLAYDLNGQSLPKEIKLSNGKCIKNDVNDELNAGSLSYRALLKGILTDEEIEKLGDRKKGLGSGSAIRASVFDKILKNKKKDAFAERLKIFLNYVYDEDLYIVFKSHYVIKWYLIPAKSFIECILLSYKNDESHFEKIWYRWENNNLRFKWKPLIKKLDEYKLDHKVIEMNLSSSTNSDKMKRFLDSVSDSISKELNKLV